MLEKLFSSILQTETVIVRKSGVLTKETRQISQPTGEKNMEDPNKPLFPISKVRK